MEKLKRNRRNAVLRRRGLPAEGSEATSPPDEVKFKRDMCRLSRGAAMVNLVLRKKLKEEEKDAAFDVPWMVAEHYKDKVPKSTLMKQAQDKASPLLYLPPCVLCNKPFRVVHPTVDCPGWTDCYKHTIHQCCPGQGSSNRFHSFSVGGDKKRVCIICKEQRKRYPDFPYESYAVKAGVSRGTLELPPNFVENMKKYITEEEFFQCLES